MSDIPERLREMAKAIAVGIVNPDAVMRYMSKEDAARWIATALHEVEQAARAEGERAGIERAAKVCDDSFRDGSLTRTYECETADELAARIRALPAPAVPAKEA